MRRAKEVQVVFKDCQDKDATEKDRHCRRAMEKEKMKIKMGDGDEGDDEKGE